MRTAAISLVLVSLSLAQEPGAYLTAALQTSEQVKSAKVKGSVTFVALDGKTKLMTTFEGETEEFEVTHLKVTAGEAKGTELWSRGLRRAVSSDGKSWVDGAAGSTGEEWRPYLGPEDLVVLLKNNIVDADFGGTGSAEGKPCRLVRMALSKDGVNQIIDRSGARPEELDQRSLTVLMIARIGDENGLLYGLDLTLTASGVVAETEEPTAPEDPDTGPLTRHDPDAPAPPIMRRKTLTYQVSFEFTGHSEKAGVAAPGEVRKLLGF